MEIQDISPQFCRHILSGISRVSVRQCRRVPPDGKLYCWSHSRFYRFPHRMRTEFGTRERQPRLPPLAVEQRRLPATRRPLLMLPPTATTRTGPLIEPIPECPGGVCPLPMKKQIKKPAGLKIEEVDFWN